MTERAFFADPRGDSSTSPPTAPVLGYWQRTCDACGHTWGPTTCSSGGCSSMAFTDSYREPVPLMTRIQEKLAPKKNPPRASAAQLASLRALQGAAARLVDDLRSVDVEVRAAVVADVEELIPAQGVVNTALSITGDASPDRVAGLSLALTAFVASLNNAIDHIKKETP